MVDRYFFRLLAILVSCLFSFNILAKSFEEGCFQTRWIGQKIENKDVCPQANSWLTEPLFNVLGNSLSRPLESYCVYTRVLTSQGTPTNTIPVELQALITKGQLKDNLERDCLLTGALSSPIDTSPLPSPTASLSVLPDVASRLEKQLLRQTGKVYLPPIYKGLSSVRLAILDTLPTAENSLLTLSTRSPHGVSLAEIAQLLICDKANEYCYAHLTSQLALAYVSEIRNGGYSPYRDDYQGGFVGTITDLAKAIRREVIRWQEVEPESHLVINLSIGWNGIVWGGANNQVETFSAPVNSVFDAITDAVCHGALIISASGNIGKNSEQDYQAMLPAKWEQMPQPSAEKCRKLTGIASTKKSQDIEGSLVYGVSAIDSLGKPLSNSRIEAYSKVVAFGDHGTVKLPETTNTEVLTGSSISTIVVSSIASMVWSQRPELSGADVMQLIYSAGEELDFQADFHLKDESSVYLSHRASMCSALKAACDTGSCVQPIACDWPQERISLQGTSIFTDPATDIYDLNSLTGCIEEVDGDCSFKEHESDAISAWTTPQPDSDVCPNCTANLVDQTLIIQTSASYSGEVSDVVLLINDKYYSLPNFNLGDKIVITAMPPDVSAGNTQLSYLVNGHHRKIIPLLISE